MSDARIDILTLKMDRMLKKFSYTPSNPSIFRIGDDLRGEKPMDYEPKLIAIGLLHRGNSKLKEMEEHKKWYVKLLLQRKGEFTVGRYVDAISHLEVEARKCYGEDIKLDPHEFLQMLIFDGCFVIEFLLRLEGKVCWHDDDTIPKHEQAPTRLLSDLMILENQMPFLIIERLFTMIKISDEDNINTLIRPLLTLLPNDISSLEPHNLPVIPSENSHHLLGVVHYYVLCSSFDMLSRTGSGNSGERMYISSAVDLKKAGISFKRSEDNSLFRIEFKNKAMIIPEWHVSTTESLIRNLTAYEHYLKDGSKKYVTDYIFVMQCLVRSSEDVKLLRSSGIIVNNSGGDEMVYAVINQLGKIIKTSDQFSYYNIFNNVNRHCGCSRNTWMSILWEKYFNGPWALIRVFAAITLLVLGMMQTTFAFLSYRNDLKDKGR